MNRPCMRLLGNCFDFDDLGIDFEPTDYNWFVMKHVNLVKSQSSSDDEKVTALNHIGHLAYIGTKERSIQIIACVMPLMLFWLKHWKEINPVLLKPLLKSLGMISHRSRLAQMVSVTKEMVYDDPSLMPIISKLIVSTEEESICRWTCYFLLHLISDSGKLLTLCAGNEELKLSLRKAAGIRWDGWLDGKNIAAKLLELLAPK